jgi:hypothetical protein
MSTSASHWERVAVDALMFTLDTPGRVRYGPADGAAEADWLYSHGLPGRNAVHHVFQTDPKLGYVVEREVIDAQADDNLASAIGIDPFTGQPPRQSPEMEAIAELSRELHGMRAEFTMLASHIGALIRKMETNT